MSTVREILRTKGNTVWSVSLEDTIYDTLKFMAEKNVGAVLVLDGNTIAGIFSERDFARNAVKSILWPKEIKVNAMMTSVVLFVSPSQTTEECMSLMTDKHVRHLPVVEDDQLIGLISIGDVVHRIIEDDKFSISQLESYVTG